MKRWWERWAFWRRSHRNGSKSEELQWAKAKADDLTKRTNKIARENNLAAEIRKALGAN